MLRHILLIRRYRIRFLLQSKMLSWKSTFFVESQNNLWSLCYKKTTFSFDKFKRALRIPIIVYRRNLRLMEIQDKSTGLSRMPLIIVHDENIEQDGISHVYYEIKSGVHRFYFFVTKFVF